MYHEYPWLWCMTGDYESTTWLIFTRLIRTAVMYSRLLTSKHPNFNTDLQFLYLSRDVSHTPRDFLDLSHDMSHDYIFNFWLKPFWLIFLLITWFWSNHFLIRFWFQFFFWNKKLFVYWTYKYVQVHIISHVSTCSITSNQNL